MKKHITIIALVMLSLATVFSGCKKDKDNQGQSETAKKYIVTYQLDNEDETMNPSTLEPIVFTLSPCFKANFTYVDANGQTVEMKDVVLPWKQEITVTAPFNAKMEGALTYNESELPDQVTYGVRGGISYKRIDGGGINLDVSGGFYSDSKESFIQHIASSPKRLKIDFSKSIE